ncbi:transcription initiation factor IIE, beta subunit, partial [Tothia fuscella]
TPSNTSTSNKAGGMKRKWETEKQLPAQASKGPAAPQDIVTQVEYAVRYLIEKNSPQTFTDIINYLSIQAADPAQLNKLRNVLQRDWHGSRVKYDSRGANGAGTFEFKPKIPVKNAEELKGYLQRQDHSVGLKMDDLKDGWQKYQDEISRMETEKELLVVRNNKGQPRTIWQDDPTMSNPISDALKQKWHDIRLPANPDDVRAKLQSAGLKPTSEPKRLASGRPQEKKKRAARRGGRQTNSHMNGILKDYSNRRK